MEQGIIDIFLEIAKELFNFPVWWYVFTINLVSLVFHFSPIAHFNFVKKNKAMVVFLMASIGAALLGIRDLLSHNFILTDEDMIYQGRLLSSWAVSVMLYHIGGVRWGVKIAKTKMKSTAKKD